MIPAAARVGIWRKTQPVSRDKKTKQINQTKSSPFLSLSSLLLSFVLSAFTCTNSHQNPEILHEMVTRTKSGKIASYSSFQVFRATCTGGKKIPCLEIGVCVPGAPPAARVSRGGERAAKPRPTTRAGITTLSASSRRTHGSCQASRKRPRPSSARAAIRAGRPNTRNHDNASAGGRRTHG